MEIKPKTHSITNLWFVALDHGKLLAQCQVCDWRQTYDETMSLKGIKADHARWQKKPQGVGGRPNA